MASKLQTTSPPSVSRGITGALLFTRALSFLMLQLIIASIFLINGSDDWWGRSQAFWPITGIAGSIITFYILQKMLQAEGTGYLSLIRIHKPTAKRNALFVLLLTMAVIPVTYFSNILFSQLLFSDPAIPMGLLLRPLPAWAAWLSMLMPAAIALTELPFYFGYGMEQLRQGQSKFWVIYLPVFFLALQHSFLPFIFSWEFFLWRLLMFLPMAIMLGMFLYWRPKTLPLLMFIHFLLNVATVYFLLTQSLHH